MSRLNARGPVRVPASATPSPNLIATTGDAEPSPVELAAIEAEWPLIEAGIALVDAEIGLWNTPGRPRALGWRRVRRAQDRLLRTAAALASRTCASTLGRVA